MVTVEGMDVPQTAPRLVRKIAESAQGSISGRLDVTLPDGATFSLSNGAPGRISHIILDNYRPVRRMATEGWLGFTESYLDGDWSTPDLQGFLDHVHEFDLEIYDSAFAASRLMRLWERLRFWLQRNTKRQAKKNIAAHYDLGNEFYALWLDDTMTYSSALFATGQESLEKAQTAKYAAMVDGLSVGPGDHVLEIGCGWGGFAEYAAAERGLRVTGLTISQAQHDFAVERIARAGLADQVEIKLCDYRDERGSYDGIASIEMFEAVGEKYWPAFFSAVRDRLKPGRFANLQIITIEDRQWETYRRGVDFVQKFIFPGGMLPAPAVLRREVERAGLAVTGSFEFGASYSTTLRRWHETFLERWPQISSQGFDERFRRMWEFYLCSCAATFSSGTCDVTQIRLTRPS
ncbi:MAG: cyclopropane-fatty-acyl-phospholipid synthase family protein [Pseudomonadota bacterium]